ncbi:MAG: insulinase family protein [Desulfonauticus sp.]|nr:insulinase family protein [Desulfonauticus sp.]
MSDDFVLIKKQRLSLPKGTASLYRHKSTGAKILSICTSDKNKVFGINFRTPPKDSTGVPHILEHSVLCGSKKYPLKEPFVELLKSSLQTFLNAMTYPDKTCYPVASTNEKDFYNLIDVYLDAVFFPLLHKYTFYQEGWHYELLHPEDELSIKGVVYNEMKGAYSSPDNLLFELSQQSLFPDTPYVFDAGGHPKEIIKLTYEGFVDFHKKYYHPSNSWIYFYGDDPEEKRLQILAKYLNQFSKQQVDSDIALQSKLYLNFKTTTRAYSANSEQDKHVFTLNWLIPEELNGEDNIALRVLETVLIGFPGSPLRKNLIESGLGQDLAGVGLETELRQMYFSIGLKGVAEQDVPKAERIILDTLEQLSQKIDNNLLEAGLNTIEFRIRENNTGHYPQGLVFMLKSLTFWLYDKDPLELFYVDDIFNGLRKKAKQGYFENLIKKYFLNNPHSTRVVLVPEIGLFEKEQKKEKQDLQQIKSRLSEDKIQDIVRLTKELQVFQQRADKPEDLQKIPVLTLKDIERDVEIIPCIAEDGLYVHPLETDKIVYLNLGFGLQGLEPEELVMAGVLGKLMLEMGTARRDYIELNMDVSRHTGGIRSVTLADAHVDSGRAFALLWFKSKVLLPKMHFLLDIFKEILTEFRFESAKRLKEILLEEKAGLEASFVPSGHGVVLGRLKAFCEPKGVLEEFLSGVEYYLGLKRILQKLEQNSEEVLVKFQNLAQKVFIQNNLLLHVTTSQNNLDKIKNSLLSLKACLNSGQPLENVQDFAFTPKNEGLLVSSQVNYVGRAYKLEAEFTGSALVVSRFLRTGYLWEQVRVKGGAYGALGYFDVFAQEAYFCSYRDPNHLDTLAVYDGIGPFLQNLQLTPKDIERLIIAAIGELERHKLPDVKGFEAMLWELKGLDLEKRQKIKDQILQTRLADFQHMGELFQNKVKEKWTVVLGGENSLNFLKDNQIISEILKIG